jgi:hypothetical protein
MKELLYRKDAALGMMALNYTDDEKEGAAAFQEKRCINSRGSME